MSDLRRAMEAAQQRKTAGVGEGEGIIVADSELQDRAIFSGFNLEYEELVATSTAVAELYTQTAYRLGLGALFTSCWCDGLLTGLLLASLPPTASDAGVKDDTGTEGRNGTD